MTEPTLWDTPPEPPTREESYRVWRETEEGQRVYDYCLARSLELRRKGVDHWSFRGIWEMARYDLRLSVGPDGIRLQDHHAPFMARELMARHRDLDGLFATRERAA